MTMTIKKAAQQMELPSMKVAGCDAWLGDAVSSDDAEKTITCGFFRLEKSEALDYFYSYHEMKLVVDGEFVLTDEAGSKLQASKGDVLYFRKGSRIRFETPSFGVFFLWTTARRRGLSFERAATRRGFWAHCAAA